MIQKTLYDNDKVIYTSDPHQKSKVSHVNMIKTYHDRKPNAESFAQNVPMDCNKPSPVAIYS